MAASRITKRKRTTAAELAEEKLFRQISKMPGITDANAEKIERTALDHKKHMWRRAALGILAMPPGELFRQIETDRDAAVMFAELKQGVREYLAWQRELLRVVDSAQIRIEIGLCKRDDYREIFVEAKVEPRASKRLNRLPGVPHHG